MDFETQKNKIVQSLKYGDKKILQDRLGVTAMTLNAALAIESLEGATEGQIRIWEECLKFVEEKRQRLAEISAKIQRTAEEVTG